MTNQEMREIFNDLLESKMFDWGNVIPEKDMLKILNIEKPLYGTYETFKEYELKVLSAIGFFRDQLINQGKYLAYDKGDYRVLLPNQNLKKIIGLYQSADRRLRKGIKLATKTQPKTKELDDIKTLSILKRNSISESLKAQQVL